MTTYKQRYLHRKTPTFHIYLEKQQSKILDEATADFDIFYLLGRGFSLYARFQKMFITERRGRMPICRPEVGYLLPSGARRSRHLKG